MILIHQNSELKITNEQLEKSGLLRSLRSDVNELNKVEIKVKIPITKLVFSEVKDFSDPSIIYGALKVCDYFIYESPYVLILRDLLIKSIHKEEIQLFDLGDQMMINIWCHYLIHSELEFELSHKMAFKILDYLTSVGSEQTSYVDKLVQIIFDFVDKNGISDLGLKSDLWIRFLYPKVIKICPWISESKFIEWMGSTINRKIPPYGVFNEWLGSYDEEVLLYSTHKRIDYNQVGFLINSKNEYLIRHNEHISIMDTDTKEHKLTQIPNDVTCITFSPNSKYIAYSANLKICVCDYESGKNLMEFNTNLLSSEFNQEIKWNPKLEHIILVNPDFLHQNLMIFNIKNNQSTLIINHNVTYKWSNDGTKILAQEIGGKYEIYDFYLLDEVPQVKLIRKFALDENLRFIGDNNLIATISSENYNVTKIVLYKSDDAYNTHTVIMESLRELYITSCHKNFFIVNFFYSNGGRKKIYDLNTKKSYPIDLQEPSLNSSHSSNILPNNRCFYTHTNTTTYGNFVRIHDFECRKILEIELPSYFVSDPIFSPDISRMIMQSSQEIRMYKFKI